MKDLSRRTFIASAGGAGTALTLAAGTPAFAQETRKWHPGNHVVVGVSTQDLQNQYWLQMIDAFKRAAASTGATVLLGSTIAMDPAGQAQDVSNFLARGAQAVAVSPVNPAAVQPIFDQARKSGVYVVDDHFPAEFGHYDIFLDTGPYESGELAGTYAAELINKKFGGKGQVGLLTLPENATLTTRVQGIIDSVKNNAPRARIVSQQRATSESNAETVIENMLTAHPDINTVLGWSDTVVLGGVAALQNLRKQPSNFVIVGIDATTEGLAAVKAGKMDGTVNNPPDKFGRLAFDVCYNLITKPDSDWHFIQHAVTELQLVTSQNVSQFIKS